MTHLILSNSPFEAHQNLVKFSKDAKTSFIKMGAMLFYLKDTFQEAVGGYETWDEYLKQPEIGLSSGEANRLSQIYEYFCVKMGYDPERIANIPVKNMHYLLPIVKSTNDAEYIDGLVSDAEVLTQSDFREKVYEIKQESADRTYTYLIMAKCNETGTLKKIHDVSSEEIISSFPNIQNICN